MVGALPEGEQVACFLRRDKGIFQNEEKRPKTLVGPWDMGPTYIGRRGTTIAQFLCLLHKQRIY